MAATLFTHIKTDYDFYLLCFEWTLDETDLAPPPLVVGPFSGLTAQLVQVVSGTPTVILEGSLMRPDETPVYAPLMENDGVGAISLTAAGIKAVRETPYMVRPRVTAGPGRARVRVLASKPIAGF